MKWKLEMINIYVLFRRKSYIAFLVGLVIISVVLKLIILNKYVNSEQLKEQLDIERE